MPDGKIGIGMLGMGTVGGGVAAIMESRGGDLKENTGFDLQLKKVLVRDPALSRRTDLPPQLFTTRAADILEDPEIKLVIELIGGIEPARSYISEALRRGKYVVTANKDLIATHGEELFKAAHEHHRNIFYEASVGGGIPLLHPLKRCLIANRIERLLGIVNGTTNYILTRMAREKTDFQQALAQAQANGFAEANPANDLEGRDAAYKLAILAGLAFHSRIDPASIHVEGITNVTSEDICYARELGYAIKLLAVGEELKEGLALSVHPALVRETHPLAAVFDEFNAIFMVGDSVGEVMFYGRGAGALPTASAVMADVLEAALIIKSGGESRVMEMGYQRKPIIPVGDLNSRFYLRLQACDRPGVFADLATSFGDEQVSLDMIIQKSSIEGIAEIVLVTHNVQEACFNRALSRIKALETTKNVNSVFRVL